MYYPRFPGMISLQLSTQVTCVLWVYFLVFLSASNQVFSISFFILKSLNCSPLVNTFIQSCVAPDVTTLSAYFLTVNSYCYVCKPIIVMGYFMFHTTFLIKISALHCNLFNICDFFYFYKYQN